MHGEPRSRQNDRPKATRMDMVASVALPLVVIALGIAVSAQASGGLDALIEICLSVIS